MLQLKYIITQPIWLDHSLSSNVVTDTGADAGPSPTLVLAATVMFKLVNLGRPKHNEKILLWFL